MRPEVKEFWKREERKYHMHKVINRIVRSAVGIVALMSLIGMVS